jgi:hypothetical protein
LLRKSKSRLCLLATAVAAAAGIALAGGAVASATTASHAASARIKPAATTVCSTACVDLSSEYNGPFKILRLKKAPFNGDNLHLSAASDAYQYEDFQPSFTGIVGNKTEPLSACGQGLIAATSKLCLDGAYGGDPVWQLIYAPDSNTTNYCAGAASISDGAAIQLQPCQDATTVWVGDTVYETTGVFGLEYTPFINGADTSFANPLVVDVGHANYLNLNREDPSGGVVSDRKQFTVQVGPAS